ncbi:serine dehydratase subunit alpha family protein [Anoxynatronum sibiricum]|uniref:L-cysteine desulfidase family protein n=1 Tax=Anoxynatronum sibiricum TaxID=210623 RepID=UPI0031B84788
MKREVVLAVGCTEPVAIALASCYATKHLTSELKRIHLKVSGSVYKNAKAVGIPGTEQTGIEMAIALGASMVEPVFDLKILSKVTEIEQKRAQLLMEKVDIKVEIFYDQPSLWIEVEAETSSESGRAIIKDRHDNLVYLEMNGKTEIDLLQESLSSLPPLDHLLDVTLKNLMNTIREMSLAELSFLLEGIDYNMKMADFGMQMDRGLKFGKSWQRVMKKGYGSNDVGSLINMYTTAACDARMSGVQLPVMTSSGSGNNGLIAVIPIATLADKMGVKDEEKARALAISHVTNSKVKHHIGRLSPVCGCGVSAGAGAAAGMAYLMGASTEEVEYAVINVISSLAGMICDGGKVGCALKLSASASMAWQSALLAVEGVRIPAGNGIVGDDVESTLRNLESVSIEGMRQVDRAIIGVM